MSAKSSILIRPAGKLPMVTSKKTIGFLGLGGLRCHSKAILALPLSSTNLQSLTTTIYMKKKKMFFAVDTRNWSGNKLVLLWTKKNKNFFAVDTRKGLGKKIFDREWQQKHVSVEAACLCICVTVPGTRV